MVCRPGLHELLGDAPARPGTPYGEPGNRHLPRQTHQRILRHIRPWHPPRRARPGLKERRLSRLNDLIRQLREREPALAADIEREVGVLADRRAFGLNFERHTPEAVELPGRRVRRGDKVRVLPPRGATPTRDDEQLWLVDGVTKDDGTRTADGPSP